MQAPVVEEIHATKRRQIVDQRALLRDFPLRTPEARDAWADAFCGAYFPQRQEFFFEDVSPVLTEVLQQLGLTDAGDISREVSRLMIALSKVGACNTKRRKRAKPQTQRAPRRGSTEPADPPSPS